MPGLRYYFVRSFAAMATIGALAFVLVLVIVLAAYLGVP